jgi:hypothetical protein
MSPQVVAKFQRRRLQFRTSSPQPRLGLHELKNPLDRRLLLCRRVLVPRHLSRRDEVLPVAASYVAHESL